MTELTCIWIFTRSTTQSKCCVIVKHVAVCEFIRAKLFHSLYTCMGNVGNYVKYSDVIEDLNYMLGNRMDEGKYHLTK